MSFKAIRVVGLWGAFALAFCVGVGSALVPSCGSKVACTAATCGGCCGADGLCSPGTSSAACGSKGGICSECSSSETCTAGVCTAGGNNCAATCQGCCAPNGTCINPANTTGACGSAGGACSVCTGSQSCTSGKCEDTSCTGCVISGACVTGNADSACGTGGATCAVCTGSAHCNNNQCTTSGCNGCVDGSGTCQTGSSNSACGMGGVTCATCTGTTSCNGGQCTGGSCNGCVDGSGTCQTGNTNSDCGTGGATCATCTGSTPTCTSGSCQSGTCQTGDPCAQHIFPLCTSTSTCVATICMHDAQCCTTSWNSVCAAFDVNTYCPGQCSQSFDGGIDLTCTVPANPAACPSSPCGTERWDVKTTTDPGAPSVSLNVQTTTVAALTSLPTITPSSSAPRMSGAPESQTYFVKNAVLTHLVAETDEDYHLVLQDPTTGAQMIGEIPCPSCASGGVFECRITHARAEFEAKFGANPATQSISVPISAVGIGYYDPPHGQTGAAVNNLELHPLLGVCFTTDCDPTAN